MKNSFIATMGALTAAAVVVCAAPPAPAAASSGQVQHIVIVVQEGRSFDDLFCGYRGADGAPCAKPLHPIGLAANCTLSDTFEDFEADLKSGSFSGEKARCPGIKAPQYGYVPHNQTRPYSVLARDYVLGDRMFSSTGNPSFEAHQYLIAAQAAQAVDEPFGTTAPGGCVYREKVARFHGPAQPACFDYQTLATELSAGGLSWSYYRAPAARSTAPWDAFGWIEGSASGSWYAMNSIAPPQQFFADIAAGKLANVTWITPEAANSDLSGVRSATGPAWVASLVNAVGKSQFWGTTTVLITWSGFGGWADHVTPPMLDNEGLGFRVPLIVVSPYAKRAYVSHVQYEDGSILRFAEDTFGLGRLAASDARATSIAGDCLDFGQQPRSFVSIPTN
jgi:phospholipase C